MTEKEKDFFARNVILFLKERRLTLEGGKVTGLGLEWLDESGKEQPEKKPA